MVWQAFHNPRRKQFSKLKLLQEKIEKEKERKKGFCFSWFWERIQLPIHYLFMLVGERVVLNHSVNSGLWDLRKVSERMVSTSMA